MASQAHGVLERTGVTAADAERAAWTVADDGVIAGGPRSIGLMLAVAWNSKIPMWPWKIPGVPWVLDRVYEWIAANRRRLPGDTPWCIAHPGACVPD